MTLPLWVVYDHPADDPEHVVVRRWWVDAGGTRPDERAERFPDLAAAQRWLERLGLFPIAPQPEDDPVIAAIWL